MIKTLKDVVEKRQYFESYPMQFLEEYRKINNEKEFSDLLYEIVYRLHSLDDRVTNKVAEKDLTDIKFYLTNLLYDLK